MELKPMLFWDTKTVLTYMEPNFRFNLALKIPSIRKAEKAAPLIINRLVLHENHLVIDETEYKMKVYRQCQADAGLHNGEVDNDSDEYGFKIILDETYQPGDIKLTYNGNKGRGRICTLERFQYNCQAKVNSLPCNHYIRLYVSGSMTQFPYRNMKMHHLMRRLLTILFGNRTGEWTVKNIRVEDKIMRWPLTGRKPYVRNIELGLHSLLKMNAFHSIIDLSVPIARLKMRSFYSAIEDHPLFKHVEHLKISNTLFSLSLSHFFSIQTLKVSITRPTSLVENLDELISKLMEEMRPIGVRYSILVKEKVNLDTINHPTILEISTDYMQLAMGSEAVVVVQYTEDDRRTWLNIEVISREI
ncbi:hypothetical protein B9Z55_000195 [Caenorhabditis nigoni]|uniref:DUF38 domain-containing protein n=1 Tax=Caenorhabditis nigoni TaxID=1611254 RepID=A0A2G5VI44_9PELO|nr:hypothetical protein B9Z55_000195 [Caenorhabditis nigoni]